MLNDWRMLREQARCCSIEVDDEGFMHMTFGQDGQDVQDKLTVNPLAVGSISTSRFRAALLTFIDSSHRVLHGVTYEEARDLWVLAKSRWHGAE